jgi:hypothetical protein
MNITRKTVLVTAGVLTLLVLGVAAGFYLGLTRTIAFHDETLVEQSETSRALQLSTRQLLLVQLPDRYAAIQLLAHGDNYARVRWCLQRERAIRFDAPNAECRTVELKETYVPGTATDRSLGVSDPTTSTIRLGEIAVDWSSPNWFYYGRGYGLHLVDQSDMARVVVHDWFEWTYVR